ncbi:hypothetical protein C8R43DRAFT_1239203 [Mycena crocata]|nr:hypothetical protein C8R43DRAFT_1239203 [Mycena crocata]
MSLHVVLWMTSILCLLLAAWQKFCHSAPPWIKQLDSLGQPRKQKLSGTAIICGGSIAGLVTARICADHFERVVIIDPEVEDVKKAKTRIMQYNAAHGFLALFINGARRLWPTFDLEIKSAGGRTCAADMQLHYSGLPILAPYKKYPPGQLPDTPAIRRPTLQKVMHTLVVNDSTSNITIVPGTVRGVTACGDAAIQSVEVRHLDGTQTSLHDVGIVADCTGATQAGRKWLKAAGFTIPNNLHHSYNAQLRYITITFAVPPDLAAKLPIPEAQTQTSVVYLYVPHNEEGSSLVALFITDNDTMQLLIEDSYGAALPQTAVEIVPFITGFQGFDAPIRAWVMETIGFLCEHGNPSFDSLKISPQSYVQYHNLPPESLPSNFVALGDATLQLNPTFGHGFVKVMMNGLALNSLLHAVHPSVTGLPAGFSARYFQSIAPCMQALWDSTRLHDYGNPTCKPVEGETKDAGRFMRWFERRLLSAATQDEEVASVFGMFETCLQRTGHF